MRGIIGVWVCEDEQGRMHIFEAVPRNQFTLCLRQPKDLGTDVCIALSLDIVKRPAAPDRIEDEAGALLLRQGCVHLAEAVCVAACASVSHNECDLREWGGLARTGR